MLDKCKHQYSSLQTMSRISFLSSSPLALLHHSRPNASVSVIDLKRSLSASHSATCTPRPSYATKKTIRCQAVGETPTTPQKSQLYQGVYGPWTVEPSDVREVLSFCFLFLFKLLLEFRIKMESKILFTKESVISHISIHDLMVAETSVPSSVIYSFPVRQFPLPS